MLEILNLIGWSTFSKFSKHKVCHSEERRITRGILQSLTIQIVIFLHADSADLSKFFCSKTVK
ncbi:hypothetical protein BSF41_31880 [Flavobacterium sp. ACN2]|nr:hypothetical protein BSF41_31880 [Flavobacterium sp. ACN2]